MYTAPKKGGPFRGGRSDRQTDRDPHQRTQVDASYKINVLHDFLATARYYLRTPTGTIYILGHQRAPYLRTPAGTIS